jgi:uncharacterized protein with FMN-binding domain
MKCALLIAGGTVGSLGAVFAITPPQLSSTESALGTGLDVAPVASATTDTAAPAATQDPTPAATKAASATKTTAATSSKNTTTSGAIASATPTAAATKVAQTQAPATTTTSGKAQNGTFTGDGYTMRYGTVQVKITISNGKITDAVAVQAPSGRDQRYTDMAVPVMRQKTLAAQSSNITGVSGASYTAYAWYVSLQSALSKAGWM